MFKVIRRILIRLAGERLSGEFFKTFDSTPQVWATILLTFALWCSWNGPVDLWNEVGSQFDSARSESSVELAKGKSDSGAKAEEVGSSGVGQPEAAMGKKGKIRWTWKLLQEVLVAVLIQCVGKLLVTSTLAVLFVIAIQQVVRERIQSTGSERDKNLEQLKGLLEGHAGISKVYPAQVKTPALRQPYADDVVAQAKKSRSMRLLTIAGYEFIGKGDESLLLQTLKDGGPSEIEIVLLKPDDPKTKVVFDERVEALRERDSAVSSQKIQQQVKDTIARMAEVRTTTGKRVEVIQCSQHPIFRILLFDDCLFVSAYRRGAHGHESPMFRIERHVDGGHVTWFESFERYYQLVRTSVSRGRPR